MFKVEVKLTDGTIHIVQDEEETEQDFLERVKYDNGNIIKDQEGYYIPIKNISKFKFV